MLGYVVWMPLFFPTLSRRLELCLHELGGRREVRDAGPEDRVNVEHV